MEHGEIVVGLVPGGRIYGKVVITEVETLVIWNVGSKLPQGKFPILSMTEADKQAA